MKNILKKGVISTILILTAGNASAAHLCVGTRCLENIEMTNCLNVLCYGATGYSCHLCAPGYKLYDHGEIQSDNCVYNYKSCVLDCPACTNCVSDTDWRPSGTPGFESKTTATCDCGTCKKSNATRCAAGYYGVANGLAMSGCTRCPESGESVAGNTPLSQCYRPSGTNFLDNNGIYNFKSNCYYGN